MNLLQSHLPDFLKPTLRFIRYPQQRRKWFRELKIKKEQDEKIKEEYGRHAKKLVIFTIPGADWETGLDNISGGLISIVSLYAESRKLENFHGASVILCTFPGEHLLSGLKSFDNNCKVFRFEQLPSYFTEAVDIMVHIPELMVKDFFVRMTTSLNKWLSSARLHTNILNQSIWLMPGEEVLAQVKKISTTVSVTTAHQKYCNPDYRRQYGVPLHKLSVWISPEQYEFKSYEEKENLLVVSPDPHPLKEEILKRLASINGLNIQVISGLTYEAFKKLISRAKWSLTFGEGLDGYLIEPVFSGAIGFAVYNEHFFTPDFKELTGLYDSVEELKANLVNLIVKLDNQDSFDRVQKKQFDTCAVHYNTEVYRDNIRLFYERKYTYA